MTCSLEFCDCLRKYGCIKNEQHRAVGGFPLAWCCFWLRKVVSRGYYAEGKNVVLIVVMMCLLC